MTVNKEANLSEVENSVSAFEEALEKTEDVRTYVLLLYVAGMGPISMQAIKNIKNICRKYLTGRYELRVIDIYQYPIFAKDSQLLAIPTLIKEFPKHLRNLIGSMANTERVLVGIDLSPSLV